MMSRPSLHSISVATLASAGIERVGQAPVEGEACSNDDDGGTAVARAVDVDAVTADIDQLAGWRIWRCRKVRRGLVRDYENERSRLACFCENTEKHNHYDSTSNGIAVPLSDGPAIHSNIVIT